MCMWADVQNALARRHADIEKMDTEANDGMDTVPAELVAADGDGQRGGEDLSGVRHADELEGLTRRLRFTRDESESEALMKRRKRLRRVDTHRSAEHAWRGGSARTTTTKTVRDYQFQGWMAEGRNAEPKRLQRLAVRLAKDSDWRWRIRSRVTDGDGWDVKWRKMKSAEAACWVWGRST
ncbi:hypothetical protein C8F01DRAFT_1077721 [Mycena amicta]|nr:hypothetical protein C8F01DRAFT_1077721 [Mycena amicta]